MNNVFFKLIKNISEFSVKKIIFFFMILLIFCWLFNIYNNIKKAKFSEAVIIDVKTINENVNNQIRVYRESPKRGLFELKNKNGKYISESNYFKTIIIGFENDNVINEIEYIKIIIGNDDFRFSNSNFLSQWKKYNNNFIEDNNYIFFKSPDSVSLKKSILRFKEFSSIINWQGDMKLFLKSLNIFILGISFMLSIIIIVLAKYFRIVNYKGKKVYFVIVALIFFIILYYVFLSFESKVLLYFLCLFCILLIFLDKFYDNSIFLINKEKENREYGFKISKNKIIIFIILVLAFFLRVYKADWGFPLLLHSDEPAIADQPVKMIEERTLDPGYYNRPNHISIYINNIIYDFLSHLRFQKSLKDTFYNNINFYYLVSRILSAAFGTLLVYIAFLIGKEFNMIFGFFSLLLFSLSPFFVMNSHYITPDIPLVLFILLVILFTIKYLINPSNLNLLLIILFAALATVEKYPGLLSTSLVGYIIIYKNWSNKKVLIKKILFSAFFFILLLFIISPYLFINVHEVISGITREARPFHPGRDNLGYFGNVLFYIKTLFSYSSLLLFVFFIIGIIGLFKDKVKNFIPIILLGFVFLVFMSKLSLHSETWALPMYITPLFIISYGFYFLYSFLNKFKFRYLYLFILFLFLTISFSNLLLKNISHLIDFSLRDTRLVSLEYAKDNDIDEKQSLYEHFTPFLPRGGRWGFDFYSAFKNKEYMKNMKYVIVSSYDYSVYFANEQRFNDKVAIYNEIFSLPLVNEFEPVLIPYTFSSFNDFINIGIAIKYFDYYFKNKDKLITGPEIRIYKYQQ